jgi:hypothetical protein
MINWISDPTVRPTAQPDRSRWCVSRANFLKTTFAFIGGDSEFLEDGRVRAPQHQADNQNIEILLAGSP